MSVSNSNLNRKATKKLPEPPEAICGSFPLEPKDIAYWLSDTGYGTPDMEYRISDIGYRISDIGYRITEIGERIAPIDHV